MKTSILEFNDTEQYIAHLKASACESTKLDIEVETTRADKLGMFTVMWFSVATQRIQDYIARDRTLMMRKLSLDMQVADDNARANKCEPDYKIAARERLETVKGEFVKRGLQVEPGIWKL